MHEFLVYSLVGIVAGSLAGLLGLGGGVIIVPCLILIFPLLGIDPTVSVHLAIGTSLSIVVVTQLAAVLTHKKYFSPTIIWPLAILLWPGVILGAMFGSTLTNFLSAKILTSFFGVVIFLLAVKMAIVRRKKPGLSELDFPWHLPARPIVWGVTGIIGTLSSLLGLGGGVFLVPFFQHSKVPMAKAIALSAFCTLPLAFVATIFYMLIGLGNTHHVVHSIGYVYLPAFIAIGITSMIFAPFGVKLAHRIPANFLRWIFVLFLLFISYRMLFL